MKKRPSLHPEPSSFLNSERVVFVDPKNHQRDIASWLLTRRWCYVEWERLLNEKIKEQKEFYKIFTPFRYNDIFSHLPQKHRVENEVECSEVRIVDEHRIFIANQAFKDVQALESHIQKTIRLCEQLRNIYFDWDEKFRSLSNSFFNHIYDTTILNAPNFDLQNAQTIMESDDLHRLKYIWRDYKDRIIHRLYDGHDRETWLVEYILGVSDKQDSSQLKERIKIQAEAERDKNRGTGIPPFPAFPKIIPNEKK